MADGAFARLAELGNRLVPKSLELEQRHLALGRRKAPSVELTVDRDAESLEHFLRFLTPAPRVLARFGELEVQAI